MKTIRTILLLMFLSFALNCSTEKLKDENQTISTEMVLEKKPQSCITTQTHPTGAYLDTVVLFANSEWSYFTYYKKQRNQPEGIAAVNFKCEPCENCYSEPLEFNYNHVLYEIDLIDENGIIVLSTCFNMKCYVSEIIPIPKNLDSGWYSVVFTNFPEITKEFNVYIP